QLPVSLCSTSAAAPLNASPALAIDSLSLHDALPISGQARDHPGADPRPGPVALSCSAAAEPQTAVRPTEGTPPQTPRGTGGRDGDRKSTRLNSSHVSISYAVFCLKKKK